MDRICIQKIKLAISLLLLLGLISAANLDTKQYDLDSAPKDLIWCGPDKVTVLVLTELDSLYKSEDRGFTWKRLNDIMISTGKEQLEEHENEIGKVSRMMISPVDPSLIMFLGTHGINWVGEDCGRKVKALNHGRKIKEFVFHPTERNWGLASAFTLCEDFSGEPCKIYKELFITKDLGENWDILGSYIVQFGWGVFNNANIIAGVPKERILITYEPRGRGDQKHVGWNYKIDFIYSDDFFKTKRVGAHKGNKFMITENYIFVAQVIDQDSQEVVLLGANTNDKVYNFQAIDSHQKKFREHSYTFLDTTEKTVFLHINHFGDVSRYGHIYVSNLEGLQYSLSLKYNIRSPENQCDFEKINSLEGIYIANVISSSFMTGAEQEMEEHEISQQESMEDNSNSKNKPQLSNESYRDFIKTMISFNKGGNWRRLIAPERDSEGHQYECENYCSLNLHGISSEYPPFYSVAPAYGIIIGNGNVGRYLNFDIEEIETFLSRDGGLSWFAIKKGSHIYEIGDHGGLIVIAEDQNLTNKVHYSWDEGLTWEELKITDQKIKIKNIIIEPSSTGQHFIVYGESTSKKGMKKGVVIGIDFSSLHVQVCQNPDSPDTVGSDYEKWTPNDGRGGRECLLGRKSTFFRRKRDAKCFNGVTLEKRIVIENCPCTDEDYECDVGFSRDAPGEPCISADKSTQLQSVEIHTPPAVCHSYYYISKGYRKVPGDTCTGGVQYDPIAIPCPYSGIFASLGIFFFAVIIIALVVLILVAFNKNFFQNVSEIVQEKMRETRKKKDPDYINIVNLFELFIGK